MKDDKLYLIHIIESAERIESYVRKMDHEAFLNSTLVQDAILRNLQVLAESTQRLSEETKQKRPDVDWYKIAGLRNILVHDYLGIDVNRIWTILQADLPQLKQAVLELMNH